ncbi:MAG: 4-(cytidine 5'-diphospho)-2-C-methyl-D-erythritol kinase [Spirochaetales bacterium]|nr:4-(cytidine 5'-diphospho)-2-C-methyl-D-erythritol kinase [Spirochaetales bacterium]
MWSREILSPAKINLHLDVAPPVDSGFHPLRSLFVMVSLYDRIRVDERPDGCEIQSNCDFPTEQNILYKTWQLCRERGFYEGGLFIELEKNIPSGAGLGGGSGNCASLLRLLKEKSPEVKSDEEWRNLAAELGSDVPFFMDSVAAVVTGRGEFIQPLTPRSDYHVLIVYPDLSLSTPSAFRALDSYRDREGIDFNWGLDTRIIDDLYKGKAPREWPFFNSFSDPTYKDHPQLAMIEENLLTRGAEFVTLSGSGSAMTGIFTDKICLEGALNHLKSKFPNTYAVAPLEIIPYGIVI